MQEENTKNPLSAIFAHQQTLDEEPQECRYKYGIYYGKDCSIPEYICVPMMLDNSATLPDRPIENLPEDYFIPDSPWRYDFKTNQWVQGEKETIHRVSSMSFEFIDDQDQFFTKLRKEINKMTDDQCKPDVK